MTPTTKNTRPVLDLEFPRSIGVFENYAEAQRVVDHLSDNEFPVENVVIVGTELRSVERITGRLTHRKVAVAGALSGLWMGLFVGTAFMLFSAQRSAGYLVTTPLLGALFGFILSQVGFRAATAGGTRDFSSVSQVVATKYEVLVEHHFVERARELLSSATAL